MNRIGLSAVIIAAVFGLTSCSGQTYPPRTAEEPSMSTPADSAGNTPTPTNRAEPTPSVLLNATQVQAALLTLDDLSTGWTIDSASTGGPLAAAECAVPTLGTLRTPVAQAQVSFRAADLSPLLTHSVSSFTRDTAGQVEQDFAQALDACQEYTSTQEDGISITFRAQSLPFPGLGDRTAAMRLVGTSSSGFTMTIDVVVVAVGGAASSLFLFATDLDPGTVDSAELERLARISVDRIR